MEPGQPLFLSQFSRLRQLREPPHDRVFRVRSPTDDRCVLEGPGLHDGEKLRRVCGRHDLGIALLGLTFDQVEQQAQPSRMNAVVDLLEHVEARRTASEQGGQHGEKPQCAVGCGPGRDHSAIAFPEGELQAPRRGVRSELELLHVHRTQFPSPAGQRPGAVRIGADFPQYRGKILAAVAQHRLPGEGGLPHAPGRQVEKPHAGEGSEHALGALLVAPHDPPVLPNLGKRRLVRSYSDSMAVLLLPAGLPHAEEKVRLVVLQSDGVAAGRIARVDDRLTVPPQLFTDDLERSRVVAIDADRDRVE